jgi:hypothetical protein
LPIIRSGQPKNSIPDPKKIKKLEKKAGEN